MAVFTIKAPDGRRIKIRAEDEQTAVRGAQEWAAANPKPSDGNVASPSPAFDDALAVGSSLSQFPSAQPLDSMAPRPAVTGPSQNMQTTGMIENIGAGIDQGANAILGAPVDLPVWLGNSLINATNAGAELAGAGRPIPNIPTDLPGSSEGWERTQGGLGFTTPSQVTPADSGQGLARAATEAATMAAIPELLMMKAGQAAGALPAALDSASDIAAALFGQPCRLHAAQRGSERGPRWRQPTPGFRSSTPLFSAIWKAQLSPRPRKRRRR